MKMNIDIPEDLIRKYVQEELDKRGMTNKSSAKEDPIDAAGPHFKTILEAAKRLGKGDGKPTGIRFKLNGDVIETSVGQARKDEAVKILDQYGISVARFCAAALEVVVAEHQIVTSKKKKGA